MSSINNFNKAARQIKKSHANDPGFFDKYGGVRKYVIHSIFEGFKDKNDVNDYLKSMSEDDIYFTVEAIKINHKVVEETIQILNDEPELNPFQEVA